MLGLVDYGISYQHINLILIYRPYVISNQYINLILRKSAHHRYYTRIRVVASVIQVSDSWCQRLIGWVLWRTCGSPLLPRVRTFLCLSRALSLSLFLSLSISHSLRLLLRYVISNHALLDARSVEMGASRVMMIVVRSPLSSPIRIGTCVLAACKSWWRMGTSSILGIK